MDSVPPGDLIWETLNSCFIWRKSVHALGFKNKSFYESLFSRSFVSSVEKSYVLSPKANYYFLPIKMAASVGKSSREDVLVVKVKRKGPPVCIR